MSPFFGKNRAFSMAVLAATLALFAGCGTFNAPGAGSGGPANRLVRNIVGLSETPRIEFGDFFGRLLGEGQNWAGDKLRVASISVGPAGAAGRVRGAAPVWLASIVRCDREEESGGGGGEKAPLAKLCSGESRRAVMSDIKTAGYETGFDLGKEESFFGSAAKPDQIKVGAAEAQRLADAAMSDQDAGAGQYIYELTVGREDGIPVWRIVKDCGPGAPAGGECPEADGWTVMINAETGAVLAKERAAATGN